MVGPLRRCEPAVRDPDNGRHYAVGYGRERHRLRLRRRYPAPRPAGGTRPHRLRRAGSAARADRGDASGRRSGAGVGNGRSGARARRPCRAGAGRRHAQPEPSANSPARGGSGRRAADDPAAQPANDADDDLAQCRGAAAAGNEQRAARDPGSGPAGWPGRGDQHSLCGPGSRGGAQPGRGRAHDRGAPRPQGAGTARACRHPAQHLQFGCSRG